MNEEKVFSLPGGLVRALGWDVDANVRFWDRIVSTTPTAPHFFSGQTPKKSPDVRRFYHASFLSQRQRGYCFPAGTLVLLVDGTEKPIEEITIGDEVITHLGRARRVVNTFERTYSGTMTTIQVKGWQYPLTMTENHRVFVVRNAVKAPSHVRNGTYRPGEVVKVEAKDLRPKDYVILSRGVSSGFEDLRIDVRDYVPNCVTTEDGERCRRPRGTHEVKWDIQVDEQFARFIGLYLAEGGSGDTWCRANPANFKMSFHREERDLMAFAVEVIRNTFGLESKIVDPEYSETRSWVICHSTLLGMFFKKFCGENIYVKHIDPVFFRARASVKRELIRGWIEGDGHSRKVEIDLAGRQRCLELSGTTVSEKLHRGMFRLAMSIGAKGSARRSRPKNRRHLRHDLCFYSQEAIAIFPYLREEVERAGIELKGSLNHHSHELGYLCKIDKIILTEAEEIQVYNFEVEEDHSYVANGIISKNCVGFNTCGTMMTRLRIPAGATATTGDPLPLVQLSPLYTYDIARWSCTESGYNMGSGDGLISSEAFKGSKKRGCVELQYYPSGPSDIDNHRNGTKPPQMALTEGQEHLMEEFAIADSFEAGLELMAAGFPLAVGSMIPSGMMKTDDKGFFRMKGSIVGGHCVLPDSLISAEIPKRADKVCIGDRVFGHDGNTHRVSEVYVRDYTGDMIRFRSTGNIENNFTDEHPVLVFKPFRRKGVVIRPGMDLKIYGGGRFARLEPLVITWQDQQPCWVQAKDVCVGDYLLSPKLVLSTDVVVPRWAEVRHGNNKVLDDIQVPSKDLAWLFGLYIADGCREMHGNKDVGIQFVLSDYDHVDRAVSVLEFLGLDPTVIHKENCIRIRVFSGSLCASFREWFGEGSSTKHIPNFLYHGWDLRSVLEGIQDGDGCITEKYNHIGSISQILVRQIYHILISLGERPTLSLNRRESRKKTGGSYLNSKNIWCITWQNTEGENKQSRFHKNFYAMPVRKIERYYYEGKVYNYEVDDAHSYLSDGCAVHNCYQLLDYDKDKNLAWIAQAWERWGEKTSDPHFQEMHGYTQLGTCPLDELAQWFTDKTMSTGQSEIMICNIVAGFAPLIVDYSSM